MSVKCFNDLKLLIKEFHHNNINCMVGDWYISKGKQDGDWELFYKNHIILECFDNSISTITYQHIGDLYGLSCVDIANYFKEEYPYYVDDNMVEECEHDNLKNIAPTSNINDPVYVSCYGEITKYSSRENAIKDFLNAMNACEGCERERYSLIFSGLLYYNNIFVYDYAEDFNAKYNGLAEIKEDDSVAFSDKVQGKSFEECLDCLMTIKNNKGKSL